MVGGHAGAQQNVLVDETTYDVLCGQYSVTIQVLESQSDPPQRTAPAPERPPEPTHDCHAPNEFHEHGPVDEEKVKQGAKLFCEKYGNDRLSYDDSERAIDFGPEDESEKGEPRPLGDLDAWYRFSVLWDYWNQESCGEDVDAEPVTIGDPDGLVSCENLLLNNYKNCESTRPCYFCLGPGKGAWLTRYKVTTRERAAGLT